MGLDCAWLVWAVPARWNLLQGRAVGSLNGLLINDVDLVSKESQTRLCWESWKSPLASQGVGCESGFAH